MNKKSADTPASADAPTRAEAEAAVRTLLRWAGDDPTRDGLIETPGRVVRAYEEYFRGYKDDPEAFGRLVRKVMKVDFSWSASAAKYIRLYSETL